MPDSLGPREQEIMDFLDERVFNQISQLSARL